jgi:pimeloyl-ACP methyl ester carboxylesterase
MFKLSRPLCAAAIALALCCLNVRPVVAAPFSPAPKPAESFDAGTLHVDRFGTGAQVLVFVPGLASGAWVWYDTIAEFSPGYTVYVITLPGFDGRPATNEKPLFATFARDFWAMLAGHNIEKPVLIGHSLGGTLAIALAEDHPDRLGGIVAVDGLPVIPSLSNVTPAQRQAMATQIANAYASHSPTEALAAQMNYMKTIGTNKPELVEPAAHLAARSDPKAIAAWMQEDLTCDLRPNLGKITIPFMEIMPYDPKQASPYTQEQTLDFYKSLVAACPKATVVAIAPSRHFAMLDQPEAFHKAIAQFLAAMK